MKARMLKRWWGPLGLLLVLALALFLRLPGIDRPAQLKLGSLYQDELKMLVNTVKVMEGKPLLPHWPYGIYRLMTPQFQAAQILYTVRCGRSLLNPVSARELWRFANLQLDRFIILIRAHALVLGLGIVTLTFVLGRRISGDGGGLAAALVVAIDPLMVSYSRMMYYDIAMVLFLLFYIIAAAKAWRERSIGYLYVAVALSAVAFTMKQNAGVLFVADAWLLLAILGGRRPWRLVTNRHAWLLALMTLVILWYGYPTMFTPTGLVGFVDSLVSKYYGSPDVAVVAGEDRLWWRWISSIWIEQAPPIVMVLLLLGLVLGVGFARDRHAALVVLGVGVLYYAIAGYSTHAIDRTLLPLIPLLALGAAGWIALLQRLHRRRFASAIAAVMLVFIAVPMLQNTLRVNVLVTLPDTRSEVVRWFAANVPAGTAVARENYAPHLPANGALDCPAGIDHLVGNVKRYDVTFRNSLASEPADWYAEQGIRYLIHVPSNYDRLLREQAEGFVESPTDTSARRMGKTPRYGVPIVEAIARYDALAERYPVVARYEGSPPPRWSTHRCAVFATPASDAGALAESDCARPTFTTPADIATFLFTGWLDWNLFSLWRHHDAYMLGRDVLVYDTGWVD